LAQLLHCVGLGIFRREKPTQRLLTNIKKVGALLAALVAAAGIGSASATPTPLAGRDINRNAVAANDASSVYLWDHDLGITWLRNANINGFADWTTQNNFAQSLVTVLVPTPSVTGAFPRLLIAVTTVATSVFPVPIAATTSTPAAPRWRICSM